MTTLSEHSSGIGPTCRASATRYPSPSLPWLPPTGISRPVSIAVPMTPGWRALQSPSLHLASATNFALHPSVSLAHTTTASSSFSIPASSATASTLLTPLTGTEVGAMTNSVFPTVGTSSMRLSGAAHTTRRGGSSSVQRFISSGTRMNAPNHALHLTRPSHHCCNRGVPWAGSLSLGPRPSPPCFLDNSPRL